jgi:hypothetical protein
VNQSPLNHDNRLIKNAITVKIAAISTFVPTVKENVSLMLILHLIEIKPTPAWVIDPLSIFNVAVAATSLRCWPPS